MPISRGLGHWAIGWPPGVAVVLVVALSVALGQAALTALPGGSWVQEEAIFGVVGLLAAITASAALIKQAAAGSG